MEKKQNTAKKNLAISMLLDNRNHGKVIDELRGSLKKNSKLSILAGVFSVYGFTALKSELNKIDELRLILSSEGADSPIKMAGTQNESRLKNNLDLQKVSKECGEWISNKVQARALNGLPNSQNIFHVKNEDQKDLAIHGSANFTASGLGVVQSNTFEMNTGAKDSEATKQLLNWFDTIWNDPTSVSDIKTDLVKHLDFLASDKPADLIYFITLFNLFQEFLEDIDEENIIRSKTGFKDTLVWNKLYKFQRDGVLGAIDKLERYNGCIIADSVGLGKTFEALAVIKYYELRNDRVLVLAPKKLRENWTVYTINDKRNLLAGDRFNYDVLNHTDLSRAGGMSGEINLDTVNWGNYDLIVIDESHNFRNNNSKKDGITRYQRLMDEVIKSGVRTKVLMLSATPVNNRLNDLKNQVAFITEGKDTALTDSGRFASRRAFSSLKWL